MSAAPPCGWRRSKVLRCWPCRAAIRRGCPATCPRCCTAAGRMSQPPAAVLGPPRCGCRSPPPCPCASRPPLRSRAGPLQRGKGISGRALRGGCGIKTVSSRKREKPLRPRRLGQLPPQGRWPNNSDGRRGFFATRQRECFLLYSVSFPHASHAHTRPHRPNRPMPMPVSRSGRVSMPRAASNRVWGSSSPVQSRNAPVPAA